MRLFAAVMNSRGKPSTQFDFPELRLPFRQKWALQFDFAKLESPFCFPVTVANAVNRLNQLAGVRFSYQTLQVAKIELRHCKPHTV